MTTKLLQVGRDFEIKIRSYSREPRYRTYRKLVLTQRRIRISKKKIIKIINELKEEYPDKGFFIKERNVNYKGRKERFLIFGRRGEKMSGIPIYYSTKLGSLFVPSSYVKRKYRLTCSAILYRLKDLGIKFRLDHQKGE
jgi:hypothetical protein